MRTAIAVVLLATAVMPAAAQRLPPRLSQAATPGQPQHPDTGFQDGAMISGGILGAVGGAIGGVYAGALIEQGLEGGCRGEYGCLGGGVLGFYLGEPAAVAAGVHWANHSRGAYAPAFAANLGILIAGTFLMTRLERSSSCRDCGGYLFLVGVPIMQIAYSIAIEKATTPRQ